MMITDSIHPRRSSHLPKASSSRKARYFSRKWSQYHRAPGFKTVSLISANRSGEYPHPIKEENSENRYTLPDSDVYLKRKNRTSGFSRTGFKTPAIRLSLQLSVTGIQHASLSPAAQALVRVIPSTSFWTKPVNKR